ncbi:hypothetical protein ACFQH5_20190 [Halomonas salifodinae]|uniref:Uncharacterized protein n=1 Tax=Halomonas salifodinae TaxID=438745 RepID=A0ABW2F443_9GAMM
MVSDWRKDFIDSAYQQYFGKGSAKESADKNPYEVWSERIDNEGYGGALDRFADYGEAKLHSKKMSTASGQMDEILERDSPLMQRAATQGKQYANRRGLLNSSMGAQASQSAMIDAATPIAQQDAGYRQDLGRMERGDQYTQSQMKLGHEQDLGRMERGDQYTQSQMKLGHEQDLGRMERGHGQEMQKLLGTSQANAWGVMANNATDIVAQSMDAINQIQTNPNITAADKSKMIKQVTDMRDTDIQFQQNLYSSLSSYLKSAGVFPSL